MFINILLPYKEKFSKNKASSVSITVSNNLEFSDHKNKVKVFGQSVKKPMFKKNFIGIKKSLNFFKSKNKTIAKGMCSIINNSNTSDNIIEVHNRPYLINIIKSNLKLSHFITLFLHNDPQDMRGSKSVNERKHLLQNLDKIYCVSEYIKRRFLDGISVDHKKVIVLYNGVKRDEASLPKKEKIVIFVGRIVKEKGVHLFCNSVDNIYDKYQDWKFTIVGSPKLGVNKFNAFSNEIKKSFESNGPRAKMLGYVDSINLRKLMKRASVIVIPSIWEEPFGLVAAEAMSNGTAIIASNVGGLSEVIGHGGILIDKIDSIKITKELKKLLNDNKILKKYQKKSWDNFKLESKDISKKLDDHRNAFLK